MSKTSNNQVGMFNTSHNQVGMFNTSNNQLGMLKNFKITQVGMFKDIR